MRQREPSVITPVGSGPARYSFPGGAGALGAHEDEPAQLAQARAVLLDRSP